MIFDQYSVNLNTFVAQLYSNSLGQRNYLTAMIDCDGGHTINISKYEIHELHRELHKELHRDLYRDLHRDLQMSKLRIPVSESSTRPIAVHQP